MPLRRALCAFLDENIYLAHRLLAVQTNGVSLHPFLETLPPRKNSSDEASRRERVLSLSSVGTGHRPHHALIHNPNLGTKPYSSGEPGPTVPPALSEKNAQTTQRCDDDALWASF